MAAYREVTLSLPEVRSTDLIKFREGTYKVIEWHSTSEVARDSITTSLSLKASNLCFAKLQKIDLEQDLLREGNPIHIVLGRADALRVLVPTDQ